MGRGKIGDKLEPISLNCLTNSVVLYITYSVVKSIIGANKEIFSMTVEGGLIPPVSFTVACCRLVVEKMRQFIVGTVPEYIKKNNCLSDYCSFFVNKVLAFTNHSR